MQKQSGFSLLEALIATAIVGIGFVGVYMMTSLSEQSIRESIAKEKLQMQADQILEVIEADITNVDLYEFDFKDCSPPDAGETQTYLLREYEWCQRMDNGISPATEDDERSIKITPVTNTSRIINILLEAYNKRVQIVMKRIYDK